MFLALLFTFAAAATAAENDWWWTGDGDTNSWNDANNWDVGTVPIATGFAYHGESNLHILVDSNVTDALCYRFCLGRTWVNPIEMPCYLDVTGGILSVLEQIRIGARDGENIYQGVINASGGTIDIGGNLLIGNEGGLGTVDINDGVINVGATLWLPLGVGSIGSLYLNGGTVNASDFDSDPAGTPLMDVTLGQLVVDGDKTEKINDFVMQGWLVAYDSRGKVIVDYNDTLNKTTVTALYDPNIAYDPSPFGKDLPYTTSTLFWSPGDLAELHNVYFGASPDDLIPIYTGTEATCPILESLLLDTTYYWRVDEVNGPKIWTGNLWSFSTQEYLVVEDFDSYEDGSDLLGVWDDWFDNLSRMEVFLDKTIANDGNSMRCVYGNKESPYYSETNANTDKLQIGTDWTVGNAEGLVLYFHGVADNNDESLYLVLEDIDEKTAAVKYDSNDLNDNPWEDWRIWYVDLQQFADAGLNLEHLSKVSILIGEKNRTEPGGEGTLYFDDIRLYPTACVFQLTEGDINADCFIDYYDLQMINEDWLLTGQVVDAIDPGSDDLLAQYSFNEGAGNITADSANIDANDYDATSFSSRTAGKTPDIKWDTNGIDGTNCIWFDREEMQLFSIDVPTGFFAYVQDQVTISLWINGDVDWQPQPESCVFEGYTYGDAWFEGRIPREDGSVSLWTGSDAIVWDNAAPYDWEGQWNHYAFIVNEEEGTRSIYRNAELVARDQTSDSPWGMHNGWFTLGSWWEGPWGRYSGKVDELRFYKRALSQPEIIHLAGLTDMYVPLERPQVDLEKDDTIDLKDYLVFANNWLEHQLWP